jgi:hypothetical protein
MTASYRLTRFQFTGLRIDQQFKSGRGLSSFQPVDPIMSFDHGTGAKKLWIANFGLRILGAGN